MTQSVTYRDESDIDPDKGLIEAKSAASAKKKLFKEFMTFRDAQDFLVTNASNPKMVEIWLERISYLKKKSLAKGKTIKYRWRTKKGKIRNRTRFLEFHDFPDAMELYVNDMSVDFNMRVNSIGDIGRMAVYNDDELLYQPFYDFNPQSLIYPFVHQKEGILASISGVMGSGKTDFGLFLAEILLRCPKVRFFILTNIPIQETDRINVRHKMSDLLERMIEMSYNRSMHTVVIMDETSQFFSRREPGKKRNIMLEKFLRLIRKFNASIIFIDQLKDGLPTAALQMRTAKYHKTGLTKVHFSSSMGKRNYNNYLSKIPPTKLKFDTYHKGGFVYDIPLDTLFDEVLLETDQGAGMLNRIKLMRNNQELSMKDRVYEFIKKNPGSTKITVAKFLNTDPKNCNRYVKSLKEDGRIKIIQDGVKHRLYIL